MAKKRGGGGAAAGGPGGRKRGRSTMNSGSSTTGSSNNQVSTCSNKTTAPAAFLPRPFQNNKKKQKKNFEKTTAPVDASATDAIATAAAVAAANASALAERQRVQRRELRTAVLTHGTNEKRTALRLKLHITRTKRELETQRAQLTCWDPVTYQKQQQEERKKQQEEAAAAAAENNGDGPPLRKKRGRKGPESWKLKGAARPAWQVYDFDTRYVCPHIQAHEQHQERTQRSVNLLALCRQQQEQPNVKPPVLLPLPFKARHNTDDNENQEQEPDNDDDMLLYLCRDYFDLLMQLGHLYFQAKQFKSAREAWLQCLELDYGGISTAGDDLMRMYLDLSRYEAAFRLGQRLLGSSSSIPKNHDETSSSSVWIQYSTALVAWHLKDEKAAEYLEQAIRFNPFCAYYLAFWNTFDGVMEYTHELDALQQAEEDDDDAPPQSSLEEAIEYCCSNDNQQAKQWIAMGGHVALRDILLQTIQKKHPSLTPTDVDWNARLVKLELFCQEQEAEAAAAAAAAEAEAREQQQEDDDNKKKADTSSLEANELQEETASSSSSTSANDDEDDDEDNNSGSNESMPPTVDLAMFVGMFRTAMEMVQDEDPRFAMVV